MNIVLLCATRRGYLFLEKLSGLLPDAKLQVFSFHEEENEPPFLDDIRRLSVDRHAEFFEARDVTHSRFDSVWQARPHLMFVVSWRYMIPRKVYSTAKRGTFVFHDSLLPLYSGFAPSVWAIINGEQHTGATLFEIAEEVDSGDIVAQKQIAIGPEDNVAQVMERTTQAYLQLLEENLESLLAGCAPRRLQDHSKRTMGCKRADRDNRIDWAWSSAKIHNLIRAVTRPYSGAFCYLNGRKLRIWSAGRLEDYHNYVGRIPGRVVAVQCQVGTTVLTGDGALLVREVQLEEGPTVCAAELLSSIRQTLDSFPLDS